MKTLLILRHAKSDWNNANLSDHERPLNARGKQEAPRIGELLKTEHLVPDLIMSSTAERALATAELVALSSGYDQEILTNGRLYEATYTTCLQELGKLPDTYQRVMIVAHNPGLSDLVTHLTSQPHALATATLAHLELPINQWQELGTAVKGKLLHLWQPKHLP